MTADDLGNYRAIERAPLRGTYRGYDIVSMPPPSSGGVHLIEMLNILEGYDLAKLRPTTSRCHDMIEAMKRAYADRAVFMGDPDASRCRSPASRQRQYAAALRAQIGERATPSAEIRPGKPADFEGRNTTHFSVIDRAGNAVSNTYTLNFSYGLGLVAEGTGVLLNNELDDFTAKPGTANAYGLVGYDANLPGPGKRPLSSMTPTIVLKDGKPFLITGLAGRQPHHYCGAADHRECNRLSYADRPSRQCSPPAPPVAARRGLRRAGICAGGVGSPGKTRPQHRADSVLQLNEFH